MIEVLWHGRGGQGAFTAARLLGAAAMGAGAWSLAFPSFGPERRGAPIRAFTKISQEPIGDRSACGQADFVVYLDETLLGAGWEAELKPGGRALVNTTRQLGDPRAIALDADGLSSAALGRPIPNSAFLGALARLGLGVGLADVEEAVRASMPARLHEGNLRVVREAFELVDRMMADAAPAGSPAAGEGAAPAGEKAAEAVAAASAQRLDPSAPAVPRDLAKAQDVTRPEALIPRLRNQLAEPPSLDPADFARTTCFAAGHLATKNAGWRSQRPLVDEGACTACGQCVLYCPDGCLYWQPGDGVASQRLEVDLDFCKGCGICARACRFGAIALAPEGKADAAAPTAPAVPAAPAASGAPVVPQAPAASAGDGHPAPGAHPSRTEEVTA